MYSTSRIACSITSARIKTKAYLDKHDSVRIQSTTNAESAMQTPTGNGGHFVGDEPCASDEQVVALVVLHLHLGYSCTTSAHFEN